MSTCLTTSAFAQLNHSTDGKKKCYGGSENVLMGAFSSRAIDLAQRVKTRVHVMNEARRLSNA